MTYEERKRREKIGRILTIPNFLLPWLDRFFDDRELQLMLFLASGPVGVEELAVKFGIAAENDEFRQFVERAYRRGVINYGMNDEIEPADFHARYELWALFEGWKDVPDDIRERLNAWELDHYETQKREEIETLKAGKVTDGSAHAGYLLLHEAEALLDRVDRIYLWPCNCRAMKEGCDKPLNVCLRFTNARGIGWEISRERAKEITRQAHRQGLMHMGEVTFEDDGSVSGGLCNCCADCCFPHLLAERLESQKIWPRTRYIVQYEPARCKNCGLCVRRCPFQAFSRNEKGVEFDVERCRGCGVCASVCPTEAITMLPLE